GNTMRREAPLECTRRLARHSLEGPPERQRPRNERVSSRGWHRSAVWSPPLTCPSPASATFGSRAVVTRGSRWTTSIATSNRLRSSSMFASPRRGRHSNVVAQSTPVGNVMNAIEIKPDDVLTAERLIPPNVPIVMLNLVTYRDSVQYSDTERCTGREAYLTRYAPAFNRAAVAA